MPKITKSWSDPDGLTRIYGADKAIAQTTGEFNSIGPVKCVEIKFDYTDMPAVASNSIPVDTGQRYALPLGARIEKVEIRGSSTDFVGSGSTLNVGTIDLDATSNAVVDSLVIAATTAEMNAGGENVAGWVGSAVQSAALTSAKLITWEVDTLAFSAGTGVVRIYYSMVG